MGDRWRDADLKSLKIVSLARAFVPLSARASFSTLRTLYLCGCPGRKACPWGSFAGWPCARSAPERPRPRRPARGADLPCAPPEARAAAVAAAAAVRAAQLGRGDRAQRPASRYPTSALARRADRASGLAPGASPRGARASCCAALHVTGTASRARVARGVWWGARARWEMDRG